MTTGGSEGRPRVRVLPPLHRAASTATGPSVIAHAGLAVHRQGGAPNHATLQRAVRLGVPDLEIDLVATRDGRLVLHHDTRLASGEALHDLTLRELRLSVVGILTLDEALEVIGDQVSVILDIKAVTVVDPLCRWLGSSRRRGDIVICTERGGVLRRIHEEHRALRLWRTFPDVGMRRREHVSRVVAGLLAHRGTMAFRMAGDLWTAASLVSSGPRDALVHISGLPWRNLLPEMLASVRQDISARGVTVHHPIITADLCQAAHALGMEVIAWTVNDPAIALRVARCGVDRITTDRVEEIRDAILGCGG